MLKLTEDDKVAAADKLGENATKRLIDFADHYRDFWGEDDRNDPLLDDTLGHFLEFIHKLPDTISDPHLFLTDSGELELLVDDDTTITFQPEGCTFEDEDSDPIDIEVLSPDEVIDKLFN